jgi:hypothetical protein
LRRKRLTAQVGAPHQSPARPTPFRTIGEAPPQSEPSTAIPTNQVSRPQTRATDNSPQAACSACFRCAGSSRRRADLVAAGDEWQSSAPVPTSRPLSAGIRASLPSMDQAPAFEDSDLARTPTTLTEPRHNARRVLPHACPSAPAGSARGLSAPVVPDGFLRKPSGKTGAVAPIPAVLAVDYTGWATTPPLPLGTRLQSRPAPTPPACTSTAASVRRRPRRRLRARAKGEGRRRVREMTGAVHELHGREQRRRRCWMHASSKRGRRRRESCSSSGAGEKRRARYGAYT